MFGSEADKRSRTYAGVFTVGLLLAMNMFLLSPAAQNLKAPKGDAPLALEIRHVSPPPLPQPAVHAEDARKLVARVAEPESIVLPVPPVKTKPVPKEAAKPLPATTSPPKIRTVVPKAKPPPGHQVEAAEQGGEAQAAAVGHVAGDAEQLPDRKGAILAALLHAVDARKKYPLQARRAGIEGRAALKIAIDGQGKIVACSVAASSGRSVLDTATARLGESLIGLSIPAARGQAMTVLVPIHYALQK